MTASKLRTRCRASSLNHGVPGLRRSAKVAQLSPAHSSSVSGNLKPSFCASRKSSLFSWGTGVDVEYQFSRRVDALELAYKADAGLNIRVWVRWIAQHKRQF